MSNHVMLNRAITVHHWITFCTRQHFGQTFLITIVLCPRYWQISRWKDRKIELLEVAVLLTWASFRANSRVICEIWRPGAHRTSHFTDYVIFFLHYKVIYIAVRDSKSLPHCIRNYIKWACERNLKISKCMVSSAPDEICVSHPLLVPHGHGWMGDNIWTGVVNCLCTHSGAILVFISRVAKQRGK